MANEITANGSLAFSKDGARASMSGSARADADFYIQEIQVVGTDEEQLNLGDEINANLVCFFHNLDAENSILLGAVTDAYTVLVQPGKTAGPIPWSGSTIFAKANNAPIRLEYLVGGIND